MTQFAKWLRSQLTELDNLDPRDPEQDAYDRADLIREAERRAADAGLPDAVAACQIRPGPVGIDLARRVLSACLAACPDDPPPDTIDPPQVARELRVSPDTVLDWIRKGQLTASNIATGNRPRWIIKRSDLDTFLKTRQPQPQVTVTRRKRRDDGFKKYRD
jgi:excisionase family DNA binding protein